MHWHLKRTTRWGQFSCAQCLKWKLSLPVSRMWQRWVRRSRSAVVILASPNTDAPRALCHAATLLLHRRGASQLRKLRTYREAPWQQARDDRASPNDRGRSAQYRPRRHGLPAGPGARDCLTGRALRTSFWGKQASGGPWDLSSGNAAGLTVAGAKGAYASGMGTPELNRTSIILPATALSTDESVNPGHLAARPLQSEGRRTD